MFKILWRMKKRLFFLLNLDKVKTMLNNNK
jgi:hypothetical protein